MIEQIKLYPNIYSFVHLLHKVGEITESKVSVLFEYHGVVCKSLRYALLEYNDEMRTIRQETNVNYLEFT